MQTPQIQVYSLQKFPAYNKVYINPVAPAEEVKALLLLAPTYMHEFIIAHILTVSLQITQYKPGCWTEVLHHGLIIRKYRK